MLDVPEQHPVGSRVEEAPKGMRDTSDHLADVPQVGLREVAGCGVPETGLTSSMAAASSTSLARAPPADFATAERVVSSPALLAGARA